MDKPLDLDLVVAGVERLRSLWMVMGLEEPRLMWRGASEGQEPQPDRQLVHEPESVGIELTSVGAAGRVVFSRDGRAVLELASADGCGEPVNETRSVSDLAGVTGVLQDGVARLRELTRATLGRQEARLPFYGLSQDWSGPRVGEGRGTGDTGTVDTWDARHPLPGADGSAIRMRTQRRAIHGGGPPLASRRVTGPERLIRFDAAFAVMLAANESHLCELRETAEAGGDKEALGRRVKELDAAARQLGEDETAWRPARLTIDGEPVDAIELDWDGWWVVLHTGVGNVADVYVYGPPGSRPDPLALETADASDYPGPQPQWNADAST